MQQFDDSEEVDFVVIGTGAGGGPVIAGLAEQGYSVVGFDAGPYFRPLEDFASDETEQEQLYWNDDRISEGANPLVMGGKNSGKAVGGSTVHFAMVSLRFRPEWFKARTALGYGADWPLDWREMWDWYGQAEQALSISGPITYPWGPKRPRYPLRAHPINGAAQLLARGAEAMGYQWTETPLATVSAPQGDSRPASIAASAASAAPPTPSRASSSPSSRARSRPGPRSATWPWSAGSRWARTAGPPACIISARVAGGSRRRATSWWPAMRSRRRACC